MRGLIDHGIASHHLTHEPYSAPEHMYKLYFGLGQCLTLIHAPDVFNVSLAGVRLGHCLVKKLGSTAPNGSLLDIGTGSGVHALLMRKLGNNDITATDISERSIEQAKINEHINFNQHTISFITSDLFTNVPKRQFHTIIFNPPGWRTPSQYFIKKLEISDQPAQLPASAMFYGEAVLSRFLDELPKYLKPTGIAIVGLNSLVGIRDVLDRYNQKHNHNPPLLYKLIERHTFPLFHYSAKWQILSANLHSEFNDWERHDMAAFSVDSNGTIYWSYEIIEFFHRPTA